MALKYQALNGYVNTVEIKGFTPLGNGVGSITNYIRVSDSHPGFYLVSVGSSAVAGDFSVSYSSSAFSGNGSYVQSYSQFTYNGKTYYGNTKLTSLTFASPVAYTGLFKFKIKVLAASNGAISASETNILEYDWSSVRQVIVNIPSNGGIPLAIFVETIY